MWYGLTPSANDVKASGEAPLKVMFGGYVNAVFAMYPGRYFEGLSGCGAFEHWVMEE